MMKSQVPSVAALSLLAAMPAWTSNELEEIVVTAQLREASLLETSSSTSVLTEAAIRQEAAQHLQDVLNIAPNVNFASGTSRVRYYQIRGIGERSQFQEPFNPSVGLMLDGVDFTGLGTIGTLFDIEQVEILRGPQGTLHGANALAGLINLRSNAPTDSFEHYLEATLADYDTWALGFATSGPVSEDLRYRLAVQQYRSDGWVENTFLDRDDTQDKDELTARLRLSWDIGDNHNLDVIGSWVDVENGYDGFTLENIRDSRTDEPGTDAQESQSLSLKLVSELQAFESELMLTAAFSEVDYSFDEDWVFVGFHPDEFSWVDRYQRERDSYSAQWRLLSNDESRLFNGSTDWVVGLYYLENQESLRRSRTPQARDFLSDYDTQTLAVFGQLDISLSESLTLVAGLRGESRQSDYADNAGVSFDPDKDMWGGRLALEYALSENSLIYGSFSRGYRVNGFNPDILASIDATDDPDIQDQLRSVQLFDEEILYNYELGFKGRFADDRLSLRSALFYMDRNDLQVAGSFVITPESGGGSTFIDFTDNAEGGENFGIEVELNWIPTDALSLWLNFGWLETEYEGYVNAAGQELDGRDQSHAPNYQFALGGRYSFDGGIYLQAGLEGKDGFYFSDSHEARADSYELVNARLGYATDDWEVALWGKNLTDEDILIRGFGGFGNDPRNGYAEDEYFQFGEPRMVGITASYNFR